MGTETRSGSMRQKYLTYMDSRFIWNKAPVATVVVGMHYKDHGVGLLLPVVFLNFYYLFTLLHWIFIET